MNVILNCSECSYQAQGSTQKELMNKIVMWNHVKRAHPQTAERVMRSYSIMPTDLYDVRQVVPMTA
ncbi:MAG TPA: hypothetical protein VHD31_01525 [Candidatus Paceibacterota bacterium]|nr:hypothetical protein [Candidatus Paceibacterota bacterium]